MPVVTDPASVIGDFACAFGPAAARALVAPAGYASSVEGDVHIATRGAVRRGEAAGARWLALADLVEGRCDDGVAALDGEPPHARWRGRFVQLAWSADGRRMVALTDHFWEHCGYPITDTRDLRSKHRPLRPDRACTRRISSTSRSCRCCDGTSPTEKSTRHAPTMPWTTSRRCGSHAIPIIHSSHESGS